jgi:hypothetical protein
VRAPGGRARRSVAESSFQCKTVVPIGNYTLNYWWCSPPRTGVASVRPTVWMVRGIGASYGLVVPTCFRGIIKNSNYNHFVW